MIDNLRRTFTGALLISTVVSWCNPKFLCSPTLTAPLPAPPSVLGTWKGESICVGNRPTCTNEVVVYRFEAIPGKAGFILQLADKVIEGKREVMGKLEFQYDEAKGELSCEFTTPRTHGLWQYKVMGDAMEGTLILLPGRELARRVKVKRVSESEVPAAPARELYDGM